MGRLFLEGKMYPALLLQGKTGLVVCARAFHDAGADLAIIWFNDKARPQVEPLARQFEAAIITARAGSRP
jgi:enoyl-[acyl-carrier-protein] reductase (NADH)